MVNYERLSCEELAAFLKNLAYIPHKKFFVSLKYPFSPAFIIPLIFIIDKIERNLDYYMPLLYQIYSKGTKIQGNVTLP